MNRLSKAIQLSLVLLSLLAILILLPAVLFGVVQRWQVNFLFTSYVIFYMATIWRVWKYGELTKTREDGQFNRISGVWVLAFTFVGFLAVHWLALYEFSQFRGDVRVWITNLGIVFIGAAVIVNQVAIRTLKRFFDRISIQPGHQLITRGIYSIVRHPVYLSYVLLFLGFCTMLHASFITFGLLGLVCSVWLGNRIAIEEEMLIAKFGNEYKAYQQRTKKLFPFIY